MLAGPARILAILVSVAFMALPSAACDGQADCIYLYSGVHINCDAGATCISHKEYANGVTKVRINPGSSGTAGGCTPGSGSSAKWAFDGAGDAATLSIEVHGELRWRGDGQLWLTEPARRPFSPDLRLACAKSLPP